MEGNPSTSSPNQQAMDGQVRPIAPHKLLLSQRLAFSVGHVLNDLCSAVWFTYLLVYMQYVRQLSATNAGILLLVGQVADGIATPFVGLESDRGTTGLFKYGKRKSWHLFGTISVIVSFPLLFTHCLECNENTSQFSQLIYYSAFIVIFQFGWASTQISHLSLIPELTPHSNERLELNSWRYAFTVASNIAVYSVTWAILGLDTSRDDESHPEHSSHVCPKDEPLFRNIVLTVVSIGVVFSAIFHFGLREDRLSCNQAVAARANKVNRPGGCTLPVNEASEDMMRSRTLSVTSLDYSLPCNHLTWHHWFKVPQFYKVGLLYMSTRLTINLTQAYIPFYLQNTLQMKTESIAYIPLLMYLSGFLSSFLMKWLSSQIGKKWTYFLGGIVSLAGFTATFFGEGDLFTKYGIYGVSLAMGLSGSTMLITSLAITNDLIGHNTSSGAFVFGAMSFLDKVSNGAAVMIIQTIHDHSGSDKGNFYRNVLVLVCGGASILALVALTLLSRDAIGARRKREPETPNDGLTHEVSEEADDDLDTNDRRPIVDLAT